MCAGLVYVGRVTSALGVSGMPSMQCDLSLLVTALQSLQAAFIKLSQAKASS